MLDKVKIGGLVYEVEIVEGLDKRELTQDLSGQINYRNLIISVDDSLPDLLKKHVLIHELTHGILVEAGYTEHEEEQADRIAKVLYQVLADNDFSFIRQ